MLDENFLLKLLFSFFLNYFALFLGAMLKEWMTFVDNYTSYFAFPTDFAKTHLIKSLGYSGVATFTRETSNCRPWAVEISLLNDTKEIFNYDSFDETEEDCNFFLKWPALKIKEDSMSTSWNHINSEGRCIVTKHQIEMANNNNNNESTWLYIFNIYCPRNDPTRPERELFQLKFYHLIQIRIEEILRFFNFYIIYKYINKFYSRDNSNHVLILGDFNVFYESIDVYCEEDFQATVKTHSRQWLFELLNKSFGTLSDRKLYDTFRYLHPTAKNEFTCWNTFIGGRETNYGSRIDLIIADNVLCSNLIECRHLSSIKGSDHCPVMAQFSIRFISPPSNFYSQHCTKMWPEFKCNGNIKKFLELKPEIVTIETSKLNEGKNKTKLRQSKISTFLTGVKKIENLENYVNDPNTSKNSFQHINSNSPEISKKWKQLFHKDKEKIPLCSGHKLPCVRRKCLKPGSNKGREFYSCSKPSLKPEGHPETRCNHFQWIGKRK